MTDTPPVPPDLTPEPKRVRIVAANEHGEVRCPLCQRLCILPYLVGMHADHHRYRRWGTPHAELDFEIVALVRDRYADHDAQPAQPAEGTRP